MNTVPPPPPPRRSPTEEMKPREIDPFLLDAMREVDALTPACPPIAPPLTLKEMLVRGLIQPPDAHALDCACPDHRGVARTPT